MGNASRPSLQEWNGIEKAWWIWWILCPGLDWKRCCQCEDWFGKERGAYARGHWQPIYAGEGWLLQLEQVKHCFGPSCSVHGRLPKWTGRKGPSRRGRLLLWWLDGQVIPYWYFDEEILRCGDEWKDWRTLGYHVPRSCRKSMVQRATSRGWPDFQP